MEIVTDHLFLDDGNLRKLLNERYREVKPQQLQRYSRKLSIKSDNVRFFLEQQVFLDLTEAVLMAYIFRT